jgi:hypothetical protein
VRLLCVVFCRGWCRRQEHGGHDEQADGYGRDTAMEQSCCEARHRTTTGVPTGMSLASAEMSLFVNRMHP